jgi:16S rRNA (guanine(966)-N(2))-methyltransferase RsmD
MRVISGLYKRRRLATTQGNEITRPTSDRVKENLFNTISSKIQGAVVADLFAGSGALGIECLSRGAQKVFFVENHHDSLKK